MVKHLSALVLTTLLTAFPAFASLPPPETLYFMVFFAPESAELTPKTVEYLGIVAKAATNSEFDGSVHIDGHNDLGEGDKTLSDARAAAVKDKLIKLGLSPTRMLVSGWADKRPLMINKPGAPEAQNRRVSIEVDRACKPSCWPR